jgi:hypothetical protein
MYSRVLSWSEYYERRRSPREMDVLGVPPLGRPPKKIRGERRTPTQLHSATTEPNINMSATDGPWYNGDDQAYDLNLRTPIRGEERAFSTPPKRQHYHHPCNVKNSKKHPNKTTNTHSQWENLIGMSY